MIRLRISVNDEGDEEIVWNLFLEQEQATGQLELKHETTLWVDIEGNATWMQATAILSATCDDAHQRVGLRAWMAACLDEGMFSKPDCSTEQIRPAWLKTLGGAEGAARLTLGLRGLGARLREFMSQLCEFHFTDPPSTLPSIEPTKGRFQYEWSRPSTRSNVA